ncbi:MAG: aminotransferase class V-fold PLP-dependent enzyme [Scytonematopsis contorta HA4267-MV1]|nr:aminotransferase class V-fold PLP-dependent enzyme [Scytonematopsis contorta HA4267-MV1]
MVKPEIDIVRAREDTPGCRTVLHFNNAGAALMPTPVLEVTMGFLQLEAKIGGYEAAKLSQSTVERVYEAVGVLIGCERSEIAIIENATRAWDMAFYAIPFQAGDRILTSVAEYGSNYIAFLQVARRTGAIIEVIPNDEFGQVSITALKNLIDERVKLIAITHIPTNSGLINPAAEIGAIAKAAKILYLLDACQSVGQMPINVQEIGCDILSATGRKYLRAPRGTGFLYVRQGLIEQLEPPFLDCHAAHWVSKDEFKIRSDARRFENWETNYAGKVGLGVAVDYALAWGLDAIWTRVSHLASTLRESLGDIKEVKLQDIGLEKCGIVAFTINGKNPQDICHELSKLNINTSVSGASSTRLDMEERGLESVVRASVHYYNSLAEIEFFCEAVTRIAVSA